MHAQVEGPAVAELARLFRRIWIAAGGDPFPQHEEPAEESVATSATAFALAYGNEDLRRRMGIRRKYVHAMRRARATISIMNAYFIPDRGVRRVLINAVRRGVKVNIILPGRSDVPAVQWASQRLWARLLRNGIRIFEWPGRMMHAKTAVIDSVWSTIGSYNLDNQSLFHNHEVVIVAIDRAVGARMQAAFDADTTGCREVVLAEWKRRGWWRKVVEWFWFRFRHWL
jgi:cardiolipin synthase